MVENQQPRENNNVSEHYLNDKGQKYYQNIFIGLGEEMPGRVFQALAFSPYCNDSDVVVDFGCYDGLLVRNVSAAKRIGVDANSAARKACKKLDGISGIDVEFYSSLEELDSNIADVVFSNHCLEHVPNPLQALQQIKRVLKLNGKLLLKVPFDDWRQAGHRNWISGDPNYHLYTWCPMNIGNLVTEAGLCVDWVTMNPLFWHPRLKWIDRIFGSKVFRFVCTWLSRMLNRREIYCIAHKEE